MTCCVEAPVVENVRFPGHNYLLSVRAPEVARDILPGQFVMASGAEGLSTPSPLLKRALAVYSSGEEEGQKTIIKLLLKVVGDGTRRLAALAPGDTVSLIGPLGNGFDLEKGKRKINLLVAGGIGIASFYLLANTLKANGEELRLIYGGRSAVDLVGLDDFQRLGVPILNTTDDGSLGLKGLVTEGLSECLSSLPSHNLNMYVCGPNPMMKATASVAAHHGIPCQISVEAKMACGFGVCLGCSVKTLHSYRLACQHGPVFDAPEFVWEEA